MLKEIREQSGLASDIWQGAYDSNAGKPEIVVKDAMTGRITPIAHILPDCGHADQQLMTKAPVFIRALLTLLDHSFRLIREAQQEPAKQSRKNYAAECAIKCGEPAFKKFLEERQGLERPLTDDRVETKVRSILKVSSRAELNDDPAAAARWQDLRNAFDAWRRR
nr:hypothetical protein [Sinorhizobium sp. 7-81]